MTKKFTRLATSACVMSSLLISACNNKTKDYAQNDVIFKNLDTTVKPGDDFFKYANGGWLKKNPIPPAYARWGIGNVVNEELRDRLKKINEDALNDKSAAKGSNTQKIGDFYFSGLDTVDIEKQGIGPLKGEIAKINAVTGIKSLVDEFAHLATIGVETPIAAGVGQDAKNSSKNMLQLYQGGIGLPNRDYYFNTDAHSAEIRNDYQQKHLPILYKLSGLTSDAALAATKQTYALEKFLADSSRKLEDLRDPYRNYNKMPVAGLAKLTPLVDWPSTFEKMDFKNADTVIVGQPEYYRALNKALTAYTIADWKNYLVKNLVDAYSSYLSKPFDEENFRFYGTVLYGSKEQLPRWKRVLDTENGLMGEVLGQIFVKEYFPEKTKERYVNLVEAMRTSFKEHIQKLDWMSEPTKQKAYDKLAKVTPKVGYPDKWKDFSTLTIDRGPYALNVMRANNFWHKFNADKLGKPVDRTEWDITPQTYNAYYNPSNNEIVLPAAQFLIPGVKDEDVDDAVVYGYAAASTIGHEMTHGFDDEGRQFDAAGNLKAWWQPQDSVKFTQRAKMLIDQFNTYSIYGLHVNGKATQGENIADLGGIVIGLDAFKKTDQYKEGKPINGLTPTQRFFLGYALGWLGQERKEALSSQILTNEHAPGFMRVNGPFTDVPEFYEAFHIKKGDKMWLDPDKRVKIW
ncbi:M13 family metallopeptidase [Mucilaginibacter sp. L3T2-6]|uniref:M13 family metallopeptidase n=1 Tax=Mucilaginibacter sp. L3T2-6 TaxID=3062491 RepID=UPI002674F7AF|nr:M13 family metallopeptidase [Mucilaginibacter sp. L3T2-6]MDO3640367.1 M13 family metallopeptidase [Mucilaginibacter sp. L3T2-6]MDV6213294.1 M13 family metallopeptidase [Mucilaginibacter sp. L3T2-6]